MKLTSQLRLAAREQAQMMRGCDEDHVSIVSSESVISNVNEMLVESSQ